MKNINILKITVLITSLFFYGCETVDLDQTEDPSALNASFIDPVYTANYAQIELASFVNSSNNFTQDVIRQMAMTGGNTYDNSFAPVNSNTNWFTGYKILNAIKLMEPKAINNGDYYELGMCKVIRCYILMTLVDMYGDIPYTEALMGNENLTPKYDNSAFVYKQILIELDNAIATIALSTNTDKAIDLYYSNKAGWVTLAKTLKIKLYNNARLAGTDIGVSDISAAISAIVSAGDYIDLPTEDFAFKYGTSRSFPNSRHPLYNDQYELGGGAYISNYFMWTITKEIGSPSGFINTDLRPLDPRADFYFFRQKVVTSNIDIFTLPNRLRPDHYNDPKYVSFFDSTIRTPFTVSNWVNGNSLVENGYWGRDHGNNSGIPPDDKSRTVAGVYPCGGSCAVTNTIGSVQNSGKDGSLGAGIMPILLSSYVHFILSEAILTTGVIGNARQEFILGVTQSLDKSTNGSTSIAIRPPLTTVGLGNQNDDVNLRKTNYLNFITARYDAFTGSNRLQLVVKEFYKAAWGNGIEPYNNYRRTGFPSNMQPTLEPIFGDFYSTAFYAGSAINNNPNVPNNVRTRKVFWDKSTVILH